MILLDEPNDSSGGAARVPKQSRRVRVAFLGTPLYETPDEASAVLAYLNKDTVMEVLGEDVGFLRVRIDDGSAAYVRLNSVVSR